MNLLITGASGLLGQNIAPMISTLFENVYELTIENYPSHDKFEIIKSDLDSIDLGENLDDVIRNEPIDLVLHMAALIDSRCDIDAWNSQINVNVTGTHRLLSWSVKRKVKSFYFTSTFLHLNNKRQPYRLESDFLPNLPYACAKLLNEQEIISVCNHHGIAHALFRLPSFYGSRLTRVWTVLPAMIKSALTEKKIEVYGTGSRTMNFVHTDDVAQAIMKAFESKAQGIFHIASKRSVSMLELAQIIKSCIPETIIILGERPDPNEGIQFEVDVTESAQMLGWTPLIDIDKGILDTIQAVKNALDSDR